MIPTDLVLNVGLANLLPILADSGRRVIAVEDSAGGCMFVGATSENGTWSVDPSGQQMLGEVDKVLIPAMNGLPMRVYAEGANFLLMEGGQLPTIRSSAAFPIRRVSVALQSLGYSGGTLFNAIANAVRAVPEGTNSYIASASPERRVSRLLSSSPIAHLGRAVCIKLGLQYRENGDVKAAISSGTYNPATNAYPGIAGALMIGIDPEGPSICFTGVGVNGIDATVRIPIQPTGYADNLVGILRYTEGPLDLMYVDRRYGTFNELPQSSHAKVNRVLLHAANAGNPVALGTDYSGFDTSPDGVIRMQSATTTSRVHYLPLFRNTSFANWGVRGGVGNRSEQLVQVAGSEQPLSVVIYRLNGLAEYAIAKRSWYESYLTNGFGFLKPKTAAQVEKSLAKWSDVGNVSIVRYASPVTIPDDIIERTALYDDYADAKEKNCQTNDFFEQPFNDKMSWGQVRSKIIQAGGQHVAFFGPGNVAYVTQGAVAAAPISGVLKAPVTNLNGWMLNGVKVSADIAIDAYVNGATGLSGANEFTNNGDLPANEIASIEAARTAFLAGELPNAEVAGGGGDEYDFSIPARSLNGFVDYIRLPAQAGYKGVILSIANYAKMGASILAIDEQYASRLKKHAQDVWAAPIEPDPVTV